MVWKKQYEPENEEDKISRINSAGIINITLENLWRDCYSAMAKADLTTWNRKLDAIWVLLGGDVVPKSKDDIEFTKLDLKIYGTGSLNCKKIGFEKTCEDDSIRSAKQYHLLKEKSLFLRRLQNSQGKGTAYQTEDRDDFD